jgi:large repetitive protein
MMTRVQWILVASALLLTQALMQGCSSCGDNDKLPKDAGADGGDDGGGGPGVQVEPTRGLRTSESGRQAIFRVVLTARPTDDVTIELSSSDESEGTVSPTKLVFTSSNWDAPRPVTVTGVDDDEKDGAQEYTIVTSAAESDDDDYDDRSVADVTVTNTDDESAGVTVSPVNDLETTEDGDTARFTVVLDAPPVANVVIGLTSDDTSEGTVAPASLTFTPDNWSAPQEVIVTGQEDDEADGNMEYKIVTAPAASDDDEYDAVEVDDVTLTNIDNDTAGFRVVTPAGGLITDEDGDQAIFEVRLNTKPTANVTIQLTTENGDEISFAPTSLTFTPDNWNGLQQVIVSGLPDDDVDGNQPWTIITGEASSADERYAGVNPPNVSGVNADADSPGVIVNLPEDALRTREDGTGTARFTVTLRTRPTANVTITLATEDDDEVTIQTPTLVFTPIDWDSLKDVNLVGVDDPDEDGDQPWTITVTVDSADDAYDVIDLPNITGTNIDNETPGITVAGATDLETHESGLPQDSFTVRLDSRPTASVVIGVSSSDEGEVRTSVSSLTFTVDNWASPQVITLTGQNDDIPDGQQEVRIEFAPADSDDEDYDGLELADVTVINRDDDTPGVRVVVPPAGLSTTEGGGEASFTVALATQPSGNVTIGLTSSDTGEATLSQGVLTFTPDNWNAPQTVTLTGEDDLVQDGRQEFDVLFGPVDSTDEDYDEMPIAKITGSNVDNDTAGITIANLGGVTDLVTSETPHGPVGFTVVLNSQPTAEVTIPVASLDASEGTAAPASLVFTTTNWAAPQTVNLTGVDDAVADGLQGYVVQVGPATGDADYTALGARNVQVSNTDNDTAGITVAPLTRLEVVENGDQDTFTVVLDSRPTASVTIPIASSDTGEATVSPASLTFTVDNWNAPQTVIVTGRSDLLQDGHQDFAVRIGPAMSADGNYSGRTVPDLPGTNLDIDSPAVRVIIPDGGLFTDEGGGQTSFSIVLLNAPTADVTLPIGTTDGGEGTPAPLSVTFTPMNWDSPQVITLTGQNDDVQDGPQPYFILVGPAVSADVAYGGRTVPNVRATNRDDDTAGVTLADTAGLSTSEAAGVTHTDTFTIVLTSEPIAPVTFNFTSSDTGEGTVSPGSVTFTSGNWDSPVTITVTGVQDDIDDGAQIYQIQIGSPTTTDPNYVTQFVPNVPVSNSDDDTAGVTVIVGAPLVTTEGGGTASFTVVLNSEPTASVSIPVVSGATDEGTIAAPGSGALTFDASNWSVPQTVTLRGQDDAVQDGDQTYQIHLGPIVSADATYAAIAIPDESASNLDDDIAGIIVNPLGPLSTSEAGTTATFTVVLRSQPTGPVALALVSDDTSEATVSPAMLTFTVEGWNLAQTVTVTGQDDFVADRSQPFAIEIGPAVSTDSNYDTMSVPDVLGTNADDDTPGFVISKSSVTTFEFGVQDTFTVRLTSEPTASVTISVDTTVPGEALVSPVGPSALTFTAGNWSVPQTVTVTGQDDPVLDGNQGYVIELGAGVSADLDYSGFNPTDVTGNNIEAALSCDEWHTRHSALPSGIFPLDTDREGTTSGRFNVYCDMSTDGGGFTLLSWSADTNVSPQGVPYPGLANCPAVNCPRGTSVPTASLALLFDVSTELAQGQSTTDDFQSPYGELGDYEFAGVYEYGTALAGLEVDGAFSGCAGVATGTYHDLVGTGSSEGVAVFLNSGLHRDGEAASGDFSSDANSYTWSIGARGAYCELNSAVPSSYLGTWDDGQYGPGVPAAAGSYSVWVR